jgi:ATP-dependent Clp protease adaptor protein ClpS
MPDEMSNIFESDLNVKSAEEVKTPRMYRVLMHNDHYTTMDFVVEVLIKVFHKTAAEATRIMLEIHNKGMGICGVYTYDIAVTKISRVHQMAKMKNFPLKCSFEEV